MRCCGGALPHSDLAVVCRILDRGTAAIQNILGTVIFSILPQMVDIVLACVYIAYKLEAWIGAGWGGNCLHPELRGLPVGNRCGSHLVYAAADLERCFCSGYRFCDACVLHSHHNLLDGLVPPPPLQCNLPCDQKDLNQLPQGVNYPFPAPQSGEVHSEGT